MGHLLVDSSPALLVQKLSKHYGATQALRDVELTTQRGSIHALVGANGSGKSTFVKILAGIERGDHGGTIAVGPRLVPASGMSPDLAHDLGLRFVHQDVGLFDGLTVSENIALGHGFGTKKLGRVRWRRLESEAAALIDRYQIHATPRSTVGSLNAASRTMLAIARALGDDPDEGERILILDEPTASLPEREADLLAQMLKRFAARGQTILFISHHLREILQLADNVTVLRDGRVAADVPAADLTEDELVTHICGRRILQAAVTARKPDGGEQTLAVEGLVSGRLNGVSFSANKGEVVGIAGLQGSGRSTLLRTLFGHFVATQGSVRLRGETRRVKEPADAIRRGIAYLSEDRQGEAAFGDLSIRENVVAASLREFWRGLRMAHGAESQETQRQIERFGVVTSGPEQALDALSGGNQQKVVLSRWLRREPWLLLLDEPSQGVDVGARADIHAALRRAAENGTTVLLVSSDFEELSLVCDRVLVLRDGVVAAEFHAPDINPDSLVQESYLERKEEAS